MRREYGKRRWVPDCCPECGRGSFVSYPPFRMKRMKEAMSFDHFNALMSWRYGAWRRLFAKNAWGLDRWWGVCGACTMIEEILRPSWLLARARKDASFNGGTVVVSFKGGGR